MRNIVGGCLTLLLVISACGYSSGTAQSAMETEEDIISFYKNNPSLYEEIRELCFENAKTGFSLYPKNEGDERVYIVGQPDTHEPDYVADKEFWDELERGVQEAQVESFSYSFKNSVSFVYSHGTVIFAPDTESAQTPEALYTSLDNGWYYIIRLEATC